MEQGGTIKEVCMRRVQRRRTLPRAGPMAVVIIAQRVSMSGLCEVRVDAKYLLTSMAHSVRGDKRGIDGDLWMRVFVARDCMHATKQHVGHTRVEETFYSEGT